MSNKYNRRNELPKKKNEKVAKIFSLQMKLINFKEDVEQFMKVLG